MRSFELLLPISPSLASPNSAMETKDPNALTTIKPSPKADVERDEDNPFACVYCGKKFSCSQALGGHINAHRQERFEARRERRATANANRKILAIAPSPQPAYPTTSRAPPALHHHQYLPPQREASSSHQSRQLPPPQMDYHPGAAAWKQLVQMNGQEQFYPDLDLSLRLSQQSGGEDQASSQLGLGLTLGAGQFDEDLDLTLKL
ncbi:hypothetical protein ACLOJK_017471 [Asimina triloba]